MDNKRSNIINICILAVLVVLTVFVSVIMIRLAVNTQNYIDSLTPEEVAVLFLSAAFFIGGVLNFLYTVLFLLFFLFIAIITLIFLKVRFKTGHVGIRIGAIILAVYSFCAIIACFMLNFAV